MSFLNKLFGKNETPQRQLNHPQQLEIGDIIQLTDSFALPETLRNKQFRVSAINSYEYEHHVDTEWVLSGDANLEIYLGVEVDDQTELKFSLKINHADVEALFDLEQFSLVFEEPGNAELNVQADTELTQGWSADYYHQGVFAKVGYFHRKDHRRERLSEYEGKEAGEQFEQYVLYNDEQTKGIDIEVWSDGDTDVFLTLFRPITDIVDYFPGS